MTLAPSAVLAVLLAVPLPGAAGAPGAAAPRRDGTPAAAPEGRVTLLSRTTPFQDLRVVEDAQERVRFLCTDSCGYVQGAVSLDDPDRLLLSYMRTAVGGLAFLDAPPRRMLFLGMGVGVLPRLLSSRYPSARVDVVEIDPAIPPIARELFGFPARPGLEVHVADAAEYVKERNAPYDLVVLDASFGPEVPAALATPEFLARAAALVSGGGALVANLPAGEGAAATAPFLARLAAVLPRVEAFRADANVVAVATRRAVPRATLLARARRLGGELRLGYDLAALLASPLPAAPPPPPAPSPRRAYPPAGRPEAP